MMFLRISSILVFIFISNINANTILSNKQENILNLSNKKILQDSSKLKKDWINPFNYKYIYSKDKYRDLSKKSVFSINQAVFRSGGIYYAIKYANNMQNVLTLSLNIQTKELKYKAVSIVYNIKKLDIQIKQQNLLLNNANIDLKNKKDAVFNGLLGVSFLNNALISLNKIKLSISALVYNKEKLINNLKLLSDLKYDEIKLNTLSMINKDKFLKNNLNIQKSILDLKSKDYLKGITNAKYLPSLNVNYQKIIAHSDNIKNSYNYGFNINIPIDLRTFNDIQSAKIDYLKQKEQNKLNILQENNFINLKVLSLKNIQNKIDITKQTIKLYKDLLEQTKELSDVGLKTIDDMSILENSLYNEKLNIDLYKIDEQLELLEIYKKVNNDKI